MSRKNRPLDPELLSCYVDGELDESTRTEIARRLAADPAAMDRVRAYQAQNETLKSAWAEVLEEPIPERLAAAAAGRGGSGPTGGRPWRQRVMPVLATAAALVLGLAVGWVLRGNVDESATPEFTFNRFLDHAASSFLLYASEDAQWREESLEGDPERFVGRLGETLDADFRVPPETASGYRFVGGRLLPGGAGHMVYSNPDSHLVTVYFEMAEQSRERPRERTHRGSYFDRSPSGRAALERVRRARSREFVRYRDLSIYHWTPESGRVEFAVIGDLDEEELEALAESILAEFGT